MLYAADLSHPFREVSVRNFLFKMLKQGLTLIVSGRSVIEYGLSTAKLDIYAFSMAFFLESKLDFFSQIAFSNF